MRWVSYSVLTLFLLTLLTIPGVFGAIQAKYNCTLLANETHNASIQWKIDETNAHIDILIPQIQRFRDLGNTASANRIEFEEIPYYQNKIIPMCENLLPQACKASESETENRKPEYYDFNFDRTLSLIKSRDFNWNCEKGINCNIINTCVNYLVEFYPQENLICGNDFEENRFIEKIIDYKLDQYSIFVTVVDYDQVATGLGYVIQGLKDQKEQCRNFNSQLADINQGQLEKKQFLYQIDTLLAKINEYRDEETRTGIIVSGDILNIAENDLLELRADVDQYNTLVDKEDVNFKFLQVGDRLDEYEVFLEVERKLRNEKIEAEGVKILSFLNSIDSDRIPEVTAKIELVKKDYSIKDLKLHVGSLSNDLQTYMESFFEEYGKYGNFYNNIFNQINEYENSKGQNYLDIDILISIKESFQLKAENIDGLEAELTILKIDLEDFKKEILALELTTPEALKLKLNLDSDISNFKGKLESAITNLVDFDLNEVESYSGELDLFKERLELIRDLEDSLLEKEFETFEDMKKSIISLKKGFIFLESELLELDKRVQSHRKTFASIRETLVNIDDEKKLASAVLPLYQGEWKRAVAIVANNLNRFLISNQLKSIKDNLDALILLQETNSLQDYKTNADKIRILKTAQSELVSIRENLNIMNQIEIKVVNDLVIIKQTFRKALGDSRTPASTVGEYGSIVGNNPKYSGNFGTDIANLLFTRPKDPQQQTIYDDCERGRRGDLDECRNLLVSMVAGGLGKELVERSLNWGLNNANDPRAYLRDLFTHKKINIGNFYLKGDGVYFDIPNIKLGINNQGRQLAVLEVGSGDNRGYGGLVDGKPTIGFTTKTFSAELSEEFQEVQKQLNNKAFIKAYNDQSQDQKRIGVGTQIGILNVEGGFEDVRGQSGFYAQVSGKRTW